MTVRFLFLSLFTIHLSLLHAGSGFVLLADSSKLFFVNENEIYSPGQEQLLYFQKGNIFFNGSSDERQNIFLLTSSMDYSSDKTEHLYKKDNRQAEYSFRKGKFYLGEPESEAEKQVAELMHLEKSKKWMAFYSSLDDSLLAYYNSDSLPPSTAIIVAYTLIKKFEMDKKLSERPRLKPTQTNSYSTIRPMWGNPTDNEWMWDGEILRPRWNVDPRLAWTFDGQTVKPYQGNNIYWQYSWDGEVLKPTWRTNRAEEWTWDGKRMQPIWETDWANQYIIEAGVVKPWSNVHTEKEWRMDGDIPVPLIILIISGIAKTY